MAGEDITSYKVEGHFKGAVEFGEFCGAERAQVVGEIGFAQADKVIAHEPTAALQAFVGTDGNLRGERFSAGEDGRADDGRKPGVDQDLAADDHEGAGLLGTSARSMDAVEFVTVH